MSSVNFTKMVGTGNDFIMIDNRSKDFPASDKVIVQKMCDRHQGIGSDGIIIIEDSATCDFKMRIINPDGSEVDMCGNGARCAVYFAAELNIIQSDCKIETLAGILKASIKDNVVEINMGKPKDWREPEKIVLDSVEYELYFVNTGVPHAVIMVDNVADIDVKKLGGLVRYDKRFSPDGTNCNFVEKVDTNNIRVRTYERGVEDETFSCGTGTCASALMSILYSDVESPVVSTTPLGEILKVTSNISGNKLDSDFYLKGAVDITFQGTFNI